MSQLHNINRGRVVDDLLGIQLDVKPSSFSLPYICSHENVSIMFWAVLRVYTWGHRKERRGVIGKYV